jgi:hypothetical protein
MSMRLPLTRAGLALVTVFLAFPLEAEDAPPLEWRGALATHYYTGSRALDDRRDLPGATLSLRAGTDVAGARFVVDGLVQDEDLTAAGDRRSRLREAYVDVDGERLHTRLGRQIIAWGRADRFNPTDNITPRDYELLSPQDDDQRHGVAGLQQKWFMSDEVAATLVVLPEFKSSTLPRGLFPAGVSLAVTEPDVDLREPQLGLKLDRSGAGLDVSVSYYAGHSLLPALAPGPVGALVLENPRMRVWGADFAATAGAYGLRGEVAYTRFDDSDSGFDTGPSDQLYLVLGVEREVVEDVNVFVQWLHRRLDESPAPADPLLSPIAQANAVIFNQVDRTQDGVSLSLRGDWRYNTLSAELATVYLFQRGDYALRPKVSYALTDRWKVTAFADVIRGPQGSYYGALEKNSLAAIELRYGF